MKRSINFLVVNDLFVSFLSLNNNCVYVYKYGYRNNFNVGHSMCVSLPKWLTKTKKPTSNALWIWISSPLFIHVYVNFYCSLGNVVLNVMWGRETKRRQSFLKMRFIFVSRAKFINSVCFVYLTHFSVSFLETICKYGGNNFWGERKKKLIMTGCLSVIMLVKHAKFYLD